MTKTVTFELDDESAELLMQLVDEDFGNPLEIVVARAVRVGAMAFHSGTAGEKFERAFFELIDPEGEGE